MKKISLIALLFVPFLVSAQTTITSTINQFGTWVRLATGILAALALLVFIWGLVKYLFSAGNADSKGEGKSIMWWGVIALFVLFSVFGLVRFLQQSFGVTDNTPLTPPQVKPIP